MGTSADASGVISLPNGGGALSGLGEKFAPDAHTGTGNFTVPISLPTGRNGFQPQIQLAYSTGSGNGLFGLGWALSVPGVSRKTSRGVPRYVDPDRPDVFILSGAEDLVPVRGVHPGPMEYRPRTEGLFARITHHLDPAKKDDWWEVASKDGLVSRYGTPGHAANDPAVISSPGDPSRTFSWKLTQTHDPFGNRIVYEYAARDAGTGDGHDWDQPLLTRIRYADYGDPAGSNFLVSVTFEYEDRPDPFSDHRAGFEIRTTKRCRSILVSTTEGNGDEHEHPVRRYSYTYGSPANELSLLERIEVIGFDDQQRPYDADESDPSPRKKVLPPLTFKYSGFNPDAQRFEVVGGDDLPAGGLSAPQVELVDLHGAGLPDLLEMNGSVRFWRNRGDGGFDRPQPIREAPSHSLTDPGVQLVDADGDGRMDLLVTSGPVAGYYPLTHDPGWDQRSFRRFRDAPGFDLSGPEVRLVDLDGDGCTDVLRSGSRMECYFNDPDLDLAWRRTRFVPRRPPAEFPDVDLADPRVRLADMTGDGLNDVVLVHDGNVEYWPSLGHGDWAPRRSMRQAPRFPHGYDPRRILLGDVDGDGLADLVYVDGDRVRVWLNHSGNGWSPEPIEIYGTPAVTDLDDVRLVDLHGSGVAGVLWSSAGAGSARDRFLFLDLTGGTKPYLLTEMDNHIGAVTRVAYETSTSHRVRDHGDPATRWSTALPFPVHVVARVEAIDAVSQGTLITQYRYHHGYWDGAEREFRGFGMVEQLDSETVGDGGPHFSPPTLSRTWFHQGPIGEQSGEWGEVDRSAEHWPGDPSLLGHQDQVTEFLRQYHDQPGSAPSPRNRRHQRDALRALRGSILRTELYTYDDTSRPYSVTENAYDLREESPLAPGATDRPRVFFPHLVATRTTQWERGDDPLTRYSLTSAYDDYGQPARQTLAAMPRRAARRRTVTAALGQSITVDEPRVLATHTHTEYATPPEKKYLHDRVAQSTAYEFRIDADGDMRPPAPDQPGDDIRTVLSKQWDLARQVHDTFTANPTERIRVFSHLVHHYDGTGYEGLPCGELGGHGALVRVETLVLTDEIVEGAYVGPGSDRRPGFLGGTVPPPSGPGDIAGRSGYHRRDAGTDVYVDGWYADTECRQFDFQAGMPDPRGLLVGTRDPLGNETTITDHAFQLLPRRVTDPAGLAIRAEYNLRTLQPSSVTDPNGTTTFTTFNPIGLPARQFVRGLDTLGNETLGGSETQPEVAFDYDFMRFTRTTETDWSGEPIFVHTTRRIDHASDGRSDDTIQSREYSDGFGRLVQTRTQAQEWVVGDTADELGLAPQAGVTPGPAVTTRLAARVAVSGWQSYDNKGRVIETYEPFFSEGWEFQREADAKRGQHTTTFYDPRGNVVRTLAPDGSQRRVVLGRPSDPALLTVDMAGLVAVGVPAGFEPTPWETYTYDANDLAPLCTAGDGTSLGTNAPAAHHFTPTSSLTDALGRMICQVERNGPAPATDWYLSRTTYDVRGNALTITDAHGRDAFSYTYDLLDRPLRTYSRDAGTRTSVLDARGNPIESRDSKGSLVWRTYDRLSRPNYVWARDTGEGPIALRERIHYGDEDPSPDARARKTLGRPVRHYDEAGLLETPEYDFTGNLVEKIRRTIRDDLLPEWSANWSSSTANIALEPHRYVISTRYDALNRPIELTYPQDVDSGDPKTAVARYNSAGALESLSVAGAEYVRHISYDAKGRRVLVVYGNGLVTRQAYDPLTLRLTRLRTEPMTSTSPAGRLADLPAAMASVTFSPAGDAIQDFTYTYDLAGNIVTIDERVVGCGIVHSAEGRDRLMRHFAYDPIYRLVESTGRACAVSSVPRGLEDDPRCGFYAGGTASASQANAPDLTQPYTEQFRYDPAGNMLELNYSQAGGAITWKRRFGLGGLPADQWQQALDNRLTSLTSGGDTYIYLFDDNGNLVQENAERHHTWDHADRMTAFRVQPTPTAPASLEARYLYGADGLRVKKWTRNQQLQVSSTVYVDGVFEQRRQTDGPTVSENTTLHIVDGAGRIAQIRIGVALDSRDASPPVQYCIGDHLGSSHVVAGGGDATSRTFVNREEYFAYGETSFGSFGRKRYRHSGKERDEESGCYYFGARSYAPALGRWLSPDPVGVADGLNLYVYVRCSPMIRIDPDGTQSNDDRLIELEEGRLARLRKELQGVREQATSTSLDLEKATKLQDYDDIRQANRDLAELARQQSAIDSQIRASEELLTSWDRSDVSRDPISPYGTATPESTAEADSLVHTDSTEFGTATPESTAEADALTPDDDATSLFISITPLRMVKILVREAMKDSPAVTGTATVIPTDTMHGGPIDALADLFEWVFDIKPPQQAPRPNPSGRGADQLQRTPRFGSSRE